MDFNADVLSRIQFAFTISFHIVFPTITIGLAIFIAVLEGIWLKTANPLYLQLCKFWSKLFALTFGMGVVSGVVLSYEFGTNFSRFSEATGNVLGPLMGYEVLTAFFLEAGFLGVMLFGWNKVGARLHFFSTCLVALGTTFSAFWILAANSWMQTPAGTSFIDGKFYVDSWFEVIFNPSFPYRLAHMLMASVLSASFFIMGISAWWLLKDATKQFALVSFRMALFTAVVAAPLQVLIGDFHGLQVARDQPIKLASMEGVWETQKGAPLLLFAWPDEEAEENRFSVGIPKLASLIVTHDTDGEIVGLKSVPPEERPNVPLVFFSFRLMVGLGMLMMLIASLGCWFYWRKQLTDKRWFLKLCQFNTASGVIATLAGWYVAECGRQPWVVYGLMRTVDGTSILAPERVLLSLILFVVVYSLLFVAYVHFLCKVIRQGPESASDAALPHNMAKNITTHLPPEVGIS